MFTSYSTSIVYSPLTYYRSAWRRHLSAKIAEYDNKTTSVLLQAIRRGKAGTIRCDKSATPVDGCKCPEVDLEKVTLAELSDMLLYSRCRHALSVGLGGDHGRACDIVLGPGLARGYASHWVNWSVGIVFQPPTGGASHLLPFSLCAVCHLLHVIHCVLPAVRCSSCAPWRLLLPVVCYTLPTSTCYVPLAICRSPLQNLISNQAHLLVFYGAVVAPMPRRRVSVKNGSSSTSGKMLRFSTSVSYKMVRVSLIALWSGSIA